MKPKDISDKLPKLISLIRIIWVNSPHYNTRERLTGLFRKVCTWLQSSGVGRGGRHTGGTQIPWQRCGGKSPVLAAFQNLDMGLASAFPEAPEAGCGSLRESGREPRKGAKEDFRGGVLFCFFKMKFAVGYGKVDSGRNLVPGPYVTGNDQDRVRTGK